MLDLPLSVMGHDLTLRGLLIRLYDKRATLARFVVSGGSAASVHFSMLYTMTQYVGLHYLISSTLAFATAFLVGFTMQKFWTFSDRSMDGVHKQAIKYGTVGVANLGINAALMFVLVEGLHFWYMLAQFIVCGMMTFSNFIIYHYFIFPKEAGRD